MDLVTYDKEGNEIERTIYSDYGELVGKLVYSRDLTGLQKESVLSDPKGAVLERWVYAYAGARLARMVGYDGKGKVGDTIVHSYDDAGRLREVSYQHGNKAFGKTVYTYDLKGRATEAAYYSADGSKAEAPVGPCLGAHRVTYAYDEGDRTTEAVAYEPNGELEKSWRYSYNARGQVARDIREDSLSRTTYTYAYEYDSRGNWTKRVATSESRMKPNREFPEIGEMEPMKRKIITSRQIAYY